jgi:hypothetical protein
MEERRKHVRRALTAEARIPMGAFAESFCCQVLDVSPAGARVEAVDIALPLYFKLFFDTQAMVSRNCAVIWRDAFTVGVKFLPTAVVS